MNDDLLFCIKSLARFIYFVTDEEDRMILQFQRRMAESVRRTWVYNAALGLVPIEGLTRDWSTRAHAEQRETMSIHDALIQIYRDDPKREENFYIITDPERHLADKHVQRRLLNIAHQLHNNQQIVKIIIFVGPAKFIPDKLQHYIEVVHDRGLTDAELEIHVREICGHIRRPVPPDSVTMFKGLTSYEVNMAIGQSVIKTRDDARDPRRIDPLIVAEFKRNQVKKTDLIQHIDTSACTFEDVGGVERFKAWVHKTRAAWTKEGQQFGLKPPKGVMAVGVWGCGKSVSVKAMGHAWGLPVVQLEMGRLRSSGVGESEANVYRALRLIEATAPCVTGETEVTLADGSTRPIEDLWQDSPEDLRVMCWNENNLRVETTKVTAVTRREAEAFQVKAANGYRVNATANHLHYVLRGGMPEWVRTDDLERGDMLAVPLSKHSGEDDCARFHPAGMRLYDRGGGLQDFRRGGGGFRDAVIQKLPVKWTTDLGWLLGIIEGDGFIGVNDGIGLTNTSKVLLSAFEDTLAGLFGLRAVRHQHILEDLPKLPGLSAEPEFQPCWTTSAQNQLAAEFLRAARAAILTAPPQVRAAFLAGWVDADGCVRSNKVTLTVKGPKLRKERRLLARQLVQSLGVIPSKFESKNMEITGSRARNLAGVLVEHLRLKGTKAAGVTSSDVGFDRGMGFACGAMLSEARRTFRIAAIQDMGISTGVMWRHENGTTPISERYMKKYAELVGAAGPGFQKLLEAECRWVEVQSVKSLGQRVVYDLACEGEDTHSFFANGLITHNCIVWVDEAEKSLSGNASSGASDAGTTSRTIGILSTWLQETTAQVCFAMTANSLTTMPVEFVNRMDERFFFDIPSEDERIEILKIHLRKNGQDPDNFNLAELAEKAGNMVGREIEQAIMAAMVDSFDAHKPALDEDILSKVLLSKPRIFRTMVDELREILNWVGYDPDVNEGIRARFASSNHDDTFKRLGEG